MRCSVILSILIILSCMVHAQNPESISALFRESDSTEPPKPPAEGVKLELTLIVKDINHNILGNKHILLEMENPVKEIRENTLRYSNVDGRILLSLEPGGWRITAKVDDFTTPGKDYISNRQEFRLENSTIEELVVLPVGSLRGEVYNRQGERIVNAKIRVDCVRDYGDEQTSSDDFGSFYLDYVPEGVCEVSALSDSKVGYITVNISRGELKTISISLSRELEGGFDLTIPLTVLGFMAFLVILRLSRKRKPVTREENVLEVTDRMQDILQTLKDRESNIVNLLIKNNGKLTQAEIRHFLRIPKATVSRDIYSLEQKNIIESIKIGRNKEIILSKWFLELEE